MSNTKVTTMTVEGVQAATAALKQLRETTMTFVMPLSAAERASAPRFGRGTVQILQTRLALARAHSEALPESFDLRRFDREATLVKLLDECLAQATAIRNDLHDTLRVIGPGAYESSRVATGHLRVLADAQDGLKRNVHHLKARGRKTTATSEPPAVSPSPPASATDPGKTTTAPSTDKAA